MRGTTAGEALGIVILITVGMVAMFMLGTLWIHKPYTPAPAQDDGFSVVSFHIGTPPHIGDACSKFCGRGPVVLCGHDWTADTNGGIGVCVYRGHRDGGAP